MNHVFKIVWNESAQCWQAVGEAGPAVRCKGQSRRESRQERRQRVRSLPQAARAAGTAIATLLTLAGTGHALAQLPTGGQVAAGTGSISTSGSTMTINQTSPRLVTDWQSFSVGAGNTVQFVQPSASAQALNRVLGADVSTIQGSIRANGQVFLLNPNGVLFTPTAQVNVGGLVASTLNITNENFLAGSLKFEGTSANAVINQGSLTAAPGGTVALIAARIVNEPGASVVADRGQVLMGAGSKVTLDLGGPVRIKVERGALQALIDQGGAVQANGGLVYMTAKSAEALGRTVINHSGVTRARTVATGEKGEVFLMGGMEQDRITVAGTLDASAPQGGDGGFIETSAAHVDIASGVRVTTEAASGKTGTWLIDPVDFYIKATGGNISGATLGAALATTDVTIDTSQLSQVAACTGAVCTNGAGTAGDIFVQDNITRASGGTVKTLKLLATRNIVLGDGTSAITIAGSAGNPLGLVLSARAFAGTDASIFGHVYARKTTIKTYGGDVTIGGGDTNASGYAIAESTTLDGLAGVQLSETLIDASADAGATRGTFRHWSGNTLGYYSAGSSSVTGGNVTIRGQGNSTLAFDTARKKSVNEGIWLWRGSSIATAGAGTITLDGTGGNGNGETYGRVASVGVILEGYSSLLAKTGDITLNGRGGTGYDAYGVAFTEGNIQVKTGGKLLINATTTSPNTGDGTVSNNDNAVLIRDGNVVFDLGSASEIHAPLVGGTSNPGITTPYSFTKKGVGTLTLFGDTTAWNAALPANTPKAYNAGSFRMDDGGLELNTGLTMATALYSFWQPPVNSGSGSFQYSAGAINGGTLAPSAEGQPIRITVSREDRIARGLLPNDATPEERTRAWAGYNKRLTEIQSGVVPANATPEERAEVEMYLRARVYFIANGLTPPWSPTPAEEKQAKERRAFMISMGQKPIGTLSPQEQAALAKSRAERAALIAKGLAPANITPAEQRQLATARKALVASGQTPPNATPQEKAAVQQARKDMVAKGVRPPSPTFAESVAAGRNSFARGFGSLFRR